MNLGKESETLEFKKNYRRIERGYDFDFFYFK